jgi:hypothetical protein
MSSSENHTVRDGIIVAVVSALILGAITYALGLIPVLFSWLGNLFSNIWNFISLTTIVVPLWGLILLAILSLPTVYRIVQPMFRHKSNEPSLLKYKQDTFFNVIWRWSYNYDDEPILDTINCFCPQCDTRLVYSKEGFAYNVKLHVFCETCQKRLASFDTDDVNYVRAKVARQVDRKIRTNEWKSLVSNKNAG